MSQPPIPQIGTLRIICKCGVKTERGLENVLRQKHPKICVKCGQKCLIAFVPIDDDEDD